MNHLFYFLESKLNSLNLMYLWGSSTEEKIVIFFIDVVHKRSETFKEVSNFCLTLAVNAINWTERGTILKEMHRLQNESAFIV